jgi:hypothetical protein
MGELYSQLAYIFSFFCFSKLYHASVLCIADFAFRKTLRLFKWCLQEHPNSSVPHLAVHFWMLEGLTGQALQDLQQLGKKDGLLIGT